MHQANCARFQSFRRLRTIDRVRRGLIRQVFSSVTAAFGSRGSPNPRGVLIAGEDLLSAAGYRVRSHRPKGWNKYKPGVFLKPLSVEFTLEVRQCGSWRGKMWTIERSNFFADEYRVEALVCAFENVPIWAPTYQAAMRMAE
jgi:hypothetical protein